MPTFAPTERPDDLLLLGVVFERLEPFVAEGRNDEAPAVTVVMEDELVGSAKGPDAKAVPDVGTEVTSVWGCKSCIISDEVNVTVIEPTGETPVTWAGGSMAFVSFSWNRSL